MSHFPFSIISLTHDLQRRGASLREALSNQSAALATGRAPAPQRHLKGDLAPLALIENRSARLQAEQRSLQQTQTRLATVQTSLGALHERHAALAGQLRQATLAWSLPVSDKLAGKSGSEALLDMVAILRQTVAGQHVFSGVKTDSAPLPTAQAVLAAAQEAVAGLTSASDVEAALDAFFLEPLGAFETTLYAGGPVLASVRAKGDPSSVVLPTAADPAIRQQLKGVTMAALLTADSQVTEPAQRRALAEAAADSLTGGQAGMLALMARVGADQSEVARQLVRSRNEADALELSRETLIGVDPFEMATKLENTRVALETLYAVTARISRLSFSEYMR